MPEITQIELKTAIEVVRTVSVQQAPNGIFYGSFGDTQLPVVDMERMVGAVPASIAAALDRKRYYFVPLALPESYPPDANDATSSEADPGRAMIAADFSGDLGDAAICHRNACIGGVDCTFISTRLMQDRFALSFEFYINASHHFVETAGVPESFMQLVWSQAEAGVRGETSQDAWGQRSKALGPNSMPIQAPQTKRRRLRAGTETTMPKQQPEIRAVDEKARTEYMEAAFSDAVAIYLLSLTVDFDYSELREREYPLLAAPSLAARLQHVAQLFPPAAGHEFAIRYRRYR